MQGTSTQQLIVFLREMLTLNMGFHKALYYHLYSAIDINDLNKATKFSTAHHFADDTNLMLSDKSLKKLNKYINNDLKLLTEAAL